MFPYSWGVGHCVVAYGYDYSSVYVTNLPTLNNKLTWDQLHTAWGGSLTQGNITRIQGKTEEFAVDWKE